MNRIHKTNRFRLMPDAAQEILLAKHFRCVRVVYNQFLNERIEQYKKDKHSGNYHAQALALTQLKKQDRFWLKEVTSQAIHSSGVDEVVHKKYYDEEF